MRSYYFYVPIHIRGHVRILNTGVKEASHFSKVGEYYLKEVERKINHFLGGG